MRDENGVYIGNTECIHWQCVERLVTGTCCGGRTFQRAFIKCSERGVVQADPGCIHRCNLRRVKQGENK